MKIEYRDGLIFTSIKISYKDNSKIINNVIIDTGAAISIISSDVVDDIGLYAEPGDRIMEYFGACGITHNAFIKKINEIKLGSQSLKDMELGFGIIDTRREISGLIGLDVLMKAGAVIDLKNLNIDVD